MNKMKKYLMMFAALIATTGFTACSSEDSVAGDGQKRGVVKTEFTISFPQNLRGKTRMTTAVVQGQMDGTKQVPVFRGIGVFTLYPFEGTVSQIQSSPSSVSLGQSVQLATQGNFILENGLNGNSKSHLYQNIEIPIDTKTFLFYGEATRNTEAANFTDGDLTDNLSENNVKLDGIRFQPTSILLSNNLNNEVPADGNKIAYYMTQIVKAEGWKDSKSVILQTLFKRFTSIQSGSWANVKAAVQELYNSVYDRTDDVSAAIKTAITDTKTSESGSEKFVSSTNGKELTFITIGDATNGSYPRNFGLPDGAAQVLYNSTTNGFTALTATNNFGINVSKLTDYAYPVALYYRALSPLYVSTESKKTAYETATNDWAAILETYKNSNGSFDQVVTEDTRSIAMVDKVQYAVGRLDVTVTPGNSFSLLDAEGTAVSIDGKQIEMTGVFVGGQTPVDFEFHPIVDANGKATGNAYTIYDKDINYTEKTEDNQTIKEGIYLSTPTKINHTLVLETPEATSAEDVIKIAVEFENKTTQTIVGKDNALIYPGCKFYLLGELDAFTNQKQVDGVTIKQAFKQDYITTANFTVNSLQNAYGVLPDLRSPQLELGLAVDLEWKNGITFPITIE